MYHQQLARSKSAKQVVFRTILYQRPRPDRLDNRIDWNVFFVAIAAYLTIAAYRLLERYSYSVSAIRLEASIISA